MTTANDRRGIVTGGTWCADHNRLVEHWPAEDSLVRILSEEIRGGGSACNLAIDIKRLDPDLPVSTIGLVGDDEDGRLLLQQAQSERIDCTKLHVAAGQRTTFTDAYTSAQSSRRTHLFHPGTSQLLTPDHFTFDQCDAKILHLGLPGLHERLDNPWNDDPNGWVTVLKKARAAGIKTNLELCSLPAEQLQELVLPCLPQLNYLIVNDFEIAALAKDPIEHDQHMDPQTCISNAQKIMTGCDLELVIVHFPMAAVAVTRNGEQFQHPSIDLPSNQVVGTNGAGDAFAAGALYAIHEGWPVVEALRLGHASAAASVRHIGTTDAVESWQDCMELAAEFGWRAAL